MANLVIASNNKAMRKLHRSVNSKVMDFFERLNADATAVALCIEPLPGSADSRVSTGRVDPDHLAVLFRIDDRFGETTYIYVGTWPQEEAIRLAERSTLRVNPVNGTLEGIIGELDGTSDRRKRVVVQDPRGELARALARETDTLPFLAQLDLTFEDLTDKLGVEPAIAELAMAAPDRDALLRVVEQGLAWEKSAILELAAGVTIDDVRIAHGFIDHPIDSSKSENEQILEALDHPASKMQFAFIEDDEDLRRVIESGDFGAWRTFLHPEQREYVEKDYTGAFRLSGGAGTGKTVVAIHRARRLARQDPHARVVLTTFNRTLALALETDLKALEPQITIAKRLGDPGVYVRGFDALAKGVLDDADDLSRAATNVFGTSFTFGPSRTRTESVWREVIDSVDSGLDPKFATPSFLESEYVAVVLANNVTTLKEYTKISRPGRGVRLSRPQRIAVWKLLEGFRRQSQLDRTLSFPEIMAVAAEHLRLRHEAGVRSLADHVVVDEAQDLHATHWKMLRALVPEGPNDLFIAEDSHQRIYGQPVVLGRVGIKIVGRSRRLSLNYRTTAQNLRFAVGVLSGAEYRDLEEGQESTAAYRSARRGPAPELIPCDSLADELDRVACLLEAWLTDGFEPESLAVLTRGIEERDRFVRALNERGIDARAVGDNPRPAGHVQVLTMHRSKGMEFANVVLAGIDDAHVPSAASIRSVPEEEKASALLRERSLLYVASSRARDRLVVTWSGSRTALIPREW